MKPNEKMMANGDNLEHNRSLVANLRIDNEERDSKIKILDKEVMNLKDVIKNRDSEIYKLKREIHKLKVSV